MSSRIQVERSEDSRNDQVVVKLGRLTPGLLVVALAWALSTAAAETVGGAALRNPQEAAQPNSDSAPRVSLGEITGSPGDVLMVPLRYLPAPDVELGLLTVQIEYVSNSLEFLKASPVVEAPDADLVTTLSSSGPDEKGVIRSRLRIKTSLGQNPQKGIPGGLLAFLLFEISPEARPRPIRLNTSVVSAEDIQTPARKVGRIETGGGLVNVELSDVVPETACFFYMH